MDYTNIQTFITSVGFPIVMCLLMYKRMGEENDAHQKEMDSLKEALNNNTIVLEKLAQRLDWRRGDSIGVNEGRRVTDE